MYTVILTYVLRFLQFYKSDLKQGQDDKFIHVIQVLLLLFQYQAQAQMLAQPLVSFYL